MPRVHSNSILLILYSRLQWWIIEYQSTLDIFLSFFFLIASSCWFGLTGDKAPWLEFTITGDSRGWKKSNPNIFRLQFKGTTFPLGVVFAGLASKENFPVESIVGQRLWFLHLCGIQKVCRRDLIKIYESHVVTEVFLSTLSFRYIIIFLAD